MNPTPEQWARLKQLFDEAKDLSLPARTAFVARVRSDEGEAMAEQLEALLKAHDEQTRQADEPIVWPLDPPKPSAFKIGEVILGRFQIIRLLGRGGMGEVYEANDKEMGRVALKTIRHDGIGDRSMLRRFKQEVQLSRIVTSPNVCRVHELFTFPPTKSQPVAAFLTMEFLEGGTLAERVDKGQIPWREAEAIALQLCQGLEAIHKAGVIHRDLKGRNVMLTTRAGAPCAVITDLGLALQVGETVAMNAGVEGTPAYMAPEQFENRPLTPATDIYALGVVLYEMVTGDHPFPATSPIGAAVRRAKRLPPASSRQAGLPERWDKVIEKCIEYDQSDRFQTAGAAAHGLGERKPIHQRLLYTLREPTGVDDAKGKSARGGGRLTRRAFVYSGAGAVAAGAATAWFWPDLEVWRNPLPIRRLVAAMGWPKPEESGKLLLAQILDLLSSRLARAEAVDKQLLVIRANEIKGQGQIPETPADTIGILGTNLVLGAFITTIENKVQVGLSVLDPATSVVLRHKTVAGAVTNLSALGDKVATAAAHLLHTSLPSFESSTQSDFSDVPASAYHHFQNAEALADQSEGPALSGAIEEYLLAIKEAPHFGLAYAKLSVAFARRFEEIHDPASLKLAERNADLAMQFSPGTPPTLFCTGVVQVYSGQPEKGLKTLDALLKLDPGNTRALYLKGQAFRYLNQPALEETVYRDLLAIRPNYWPAYNELGLLAQQRSEYQQAADLFSQAEALAPRAALPPANLGTAYLLMGNHQDEARKAFERSNANRLNEISLLNLGNLAWTNYDYRLALQYYQRASQINPRLDMVWRNIGDCYTMLGEPALTKGNYRKAAVALADSLKTNPNSGADWMTLAYYSAKLGETKATQEQLAKAELLGAPDLESQLLKVQILVLLGQKEGAAELLARLVSRGLSKVSIDLAMDLQPIKNDPRLKGVLRTNPTK